MPWPTQLDYQEALAFPHHCFTDMELATALVASPGLFGLPQPITGNFANVYPLKNDTSTWAVRLFLREDAVRSERYARLAVHSPWPRCLLPFTYQPTGITLTTGSFPLLKVPWQAGELLNAWVEKNLNQSAALQAMADLWAALIGELGRAQLAHGDLQHGNIVVTPGGELRLLDYDGLWAPSLAALPPGEWGHPSYQHPQRVYVSTMDRFPALAIYVALRALALAPELWYRLDNGDNLLFRREDFADPSGSRTFALLRDVRGLRLLVAALQDACSVPPERVPLLSRYTA
ncbi:phosphotransferase family protein [Armatimonas sp.]|uniref:phosphotransferase family protein n=1 Tax=Armatimonas sp. TaxID=1872638 RepID=UPI003752907C